jgi:hypothetical protein
VPLGSPARMRHSRRSRVAGLREWLSATLTPKTNSKNMIFTNENEKLNHEKIEDKELTSLPETVHRMDARTSRNQAPKFKGKRGVLD